MLAESWLACFYLFWYVSEEGVIKRFVRIWPFGALMKKLDKSQWWRETCNSTEQCPGVFLLSNLILTRNNQVVCVSLWDTNFDIYCFVLYYCHILASIIHSTHTLNIQPITNISQQPIVEIKIFRIEKFSVKFLWICLNITVFKIHCNL